MLYPSVSNYWNSLHQTHAIETYIDNVNNLSEIDYEQLLQDAVDYNKTLVGNSDRYNFSAEDLNIYNNLLKVSTSEIMGYIEIPSIDVRLPIYHGTSDEVLQVGIGHLEGSSLPVGGESTHCVLSGHRGLPSAELFTDLDELIVGDYFTITVLKETITYEVDQILIVEPDETEALEIEEGMDYCTLMTCTPYGVNTHRLLVRGHRIANIEDASLAAANASQVEPMLVATIIGAVIILILVVAVLINTERRKRRKSK